MQIETIAIIALLVLTIIGSITLLITIAYELTTWLVNSVQSIFHSLTNLSNNRQIR